MPVFVIDMPIWEPKSCYKILIFYYKTKRVTVTETLLMRAMPLWSGTHKKPTCRSFTAIALLMSNREKQRKGVWVFVCEPLLLGILSVWCLSILIIHLLESRTLWSGSHNGQVHVVYHITVIRVINLSLVCFFDGIRLYIHLF